MKKILCLLLAQSLLGFAETLYVDSDPSHPANHRTLLAAHEAAKDGDVIIVAPSATTYSGISITKKLTIKGNGFGGDAPPNALGSPVVAMVGNIIIGGTNVDDADSAEGAVLEGLVLTAGLTIHSKNCLVKRCSLESTSNIYAAGFNMEGCWHAGTLSLTSRSLSGSVTIRATSYNIRNSIISSIISAGNGTSGTYNYCVFRSSPASSPGSITLDLASTAVRNSIFGSNSISSANLPGNTVNCLFIDSEPIFSSNTTACITGTAEDTFTLEGDWGAYYQLKAGASALTASTSGGPIGIFGGPTPFKVGGYPSVPRVLRAEMISANPQTGITFQVEAEARD